MPDDNPTQSNAVYDAPSSKRLWQGTGAAAAVAFIVLVTTIMPAEYGVDPLGTGALLGIDDLSDEPETTSETTAADASDPLQVGGFRSQALTFTLRAGEGTEFKLGANAGETFHYEWGTDNGQRIFFDFHGDQEANPDDFESYQTGTSEYEGGSHEVTFDGRHGWFWSNRGPDTVEVTLRISGHYEEIGFVA